jgi:hypothetical protein
MYSIPDHIFEKENFCQPRSATGTRPAIRLLMADVVSFGIVRPPPRFRSSRWVEMRFPNANLW